MKRSVVPIWLWFDGAISFRCAQVIFLNGNACWLFSFFVCIGWTNFGNLSLHMAHKVVPTMANKHALLVKKHNNDKLGAYNEIVRLAFQNTQKCTNRKLCGANVRIFALYSQGLFWCAKTQSSMHSQSNDEDDSRNMLTILCEMRHNEQR